MADTTDFTDVRSSYPVPVVAQHNATVPVLVTYDPLHLPSSLTFVATGDGGVESPLLGDTASATWWRDSGALALAPYSAAALSALHSVADGAGNTTVGAALDALTASQSATTLDFVHSHVANVWAQAAEGYTLLADAQTSCATMYDWGSRVTQYHDSQAKAVAEQSSLAVLNQTIAGGGTIYSTLWGIPQLTEQAASFYLEMYVPGLTVDGGDKIDVVVGGIGADTIHTGAGCDAVLGFEGNDSISTGDGCDRIWGGAGNNRLDGGAGVDTAMYPGTRDQYVIASTSEGFTVTRSDGVDTLVNMERVKFSDKALALDVTGCAGQAYRLYQAALGREPDPTGFGFWIHGLDNGDVPLARVAECFMNSVEFQARFGSPDQGQFVQLLYQNVLHRGPDAEGQAFWLTHLNNAEITRAQALMLFSESPENQTSLVGVMQQGMEYAEWVHP